MSTRTYTQGNLALAMPARSYDFQVVDGYADEPAIIKDETPSLRVRESAVRRRVSIVCALLVIVACVTACLGYLAAGQSAYDSALTSTDRMEISVKQGDSLWSIASEYGIEGMDTRQTVDIVSSWNDLDGGMLRPGMRLIVPAA